MNNFQNSSVTVPPHARAQAHARVGMRMSVHMPDRAAPVQRQHHLRVRGLAREWGDGSGCCALHISYYRQKMSYVNQYVAGGRGHCALHITYSRQK